MLLYEKAGNIGILTINRPEALNALNSALLDCLYEKVTEIAHDTELRCLIVTGAGKAFVAGADISEMKDLSRPEAFAFGMHGHKAFCALENLAVPVIAAVNGYALGGGCELSRIFALPPKRRSSGSPRSVSVSFPVSAERRD